MTVLFDEYQEWTRSVALYPGAMTGDKDSLVYTALGLNGEAGEVAEKIKKYIRDGTFDREALLKETGDVLWYLSRFADELGFDLSEIASANIAKLEDRRARNKQQGSGDDR